MGYPDRLLEDQPFWRIPMLYRSPNGADYMLPMLAHAGGWSLVFRPRLESCGIWCPGAAPYMVRC